MYWFGHACINLSPNSEKAWLGAGITACQRLIHPNLYRVRDHPAGASSTLSPGSIPGQTSKNLCNATALQYFREMRALWAYRRRDAMGLA